MSSHLVGFREFGSLGIWPFLLRGLALPSGVGPSFLGLEPCGWGRRGTARGNCWGAKREALWPQLRLRFLILGFRVPGFGDFGDFGEWVVVVVVVLTICVNEISVGNAKPMDLIMGGHVCVDVVPRPCTCVQGPKKSPSTSAPGHEERERKP